jgi:hypothetical protein
MIYPYVEIEPTAIEGKCRVNLWTCEDEFDTVYKGKKEQQPLSEALNKILVKYPDIRVKVHNIVPNEKDYIHIFKVRGQDGDIQSFARTHTEVPNPFRNRKRYAMVNPKAKVSFNSISL